LHSHRAALVAFRDAVRSHRLHDSVDAEPFHAETEMIDPRRLVRPIRRQVEVQAGTDAQAGVERPVVTDAQKAAVAEIRNIYDAKLAELDVMHQSKMRASVDPQARATLEEEFRRERERLTTERDAKVEKARSS